ncbi:unnamed protein product [Amoebophrya sp. A120]|nr:unnamed protein product [Amoebophrya sp. A120]|eukprot:GSA120T00007670001.1
MNTSPASHHTNRLKRRQNISHEEYPLVPPHLMKELQATSAKALDKCRAAVAEAQKKVDSHKTGDSHISFADDKEMHAIRPLSPEKGVYV